MSNNEKINFCLHINKEIKEKKEDNKNKFMIIVKNVGVYH